MKLNFFGLHRLLYTAICAGLLAAVVMTGLQWVKLLPLIEAAESYESPSNIHHIPDALHNHDHLIYVHGKHGDSQGESSADEHAQWMPQDGAERLAYTFFSNVIAGVAFGLILCSALAFGRSRGLSVSSQVGALFGVLGFAIFHLAPAYSLPPILPGMTAAGFEIRQTLWLATLIGTLCGLGLIFLSKGVLLRLLGVAFIASPHVAASVLIEAGHAHTHAIASAVPAEIAAAFVSASLITSLLFWLVLGLVSGHFLSKKAHSA